MARNRLPQQVAEVSGAAARSPGRFAGRKAPKGRPIGEPYARMTKAQKAVWNECRAEMPWLKASDRILLRQVCALAARMDEGEDLGVSAHQALGSLLSKLGATPVDATKVIHGGDEETDPGEEFFTGGRPN